MHPDQIDTEVTLEARYANFFKIGQNSTEFVFQFGQFHPGLERVWLTKIVVNPAFVKEFQRMISDSVAAYERRYGEIKPPGGQDNRQPENDRSPR